MSKTNKALHFILIDDNEIDLLFHDKLVTHQGIATSITSFSDATHALAYLHSLYESMDIPGHIVILLDLQMPVMDGFSFLDHLGKMSKTILRKIRVFCVSASRDNNILNRCASHPLVDGVLGKPLNAKELVELLNS